MNFLDLRQLLLFIEAFKAEGRTPAEGEIAFQQVSVQHYVDTKSWRNMSSESVGSAILMQFQLLQDSSRVQTAVAELTAKA